MKFFLDADDDTVAPLMHAVSNNDIDAVIKFLGSSLFPGNMDCKSTTSKEDTKCNNEYNQVSSFLSNQEKKDNSQHQETKNLSNNVNNESCHPLCTCSRCKPTIDICEYQDNSGRSVSLSPDRDFIFANLNISHLFPHHNHLLL